MGLFSKKYVTQVGTSVSRVIEDDMVPNAVKTGSIKALLQQGDIVENMLEDLVGSIGVRAESMYRYAENGYIHGSPSGEIFSATQGRQQVEAVIEQLEGQQVLMKYSYFGPPNAQHIGWIKLIASHGYNTQTNLLGNLTNQIGHNVYLKSMEVVVPAGQIDQIDGGSTDRWDSTTSGFAPGRVVSSLGSLVKPLDLRTSSSVEDLELLVTYAWETGTTVKTIHKDSFTLLVNDFEETADFFHAKYEVAGQTKYWIYENKTGVHGALDSVFVDDSAVAGSYFPFAYFRYNRQPVNSNKTTPAYLSSKKLVKYLGLDYDLVADGVNKNPSIADVEQAMLVMAVPAHSTNPSECRYLFDYFDNLHYVGGGTQSLQPAGSRLSNRTFNQSSLKTIVIQDKLFKMALRYSDINKVLKAGTIGTVGSHTAVITTITNSASSVDAETRVVSVFTTTSKVHTYCKQVATGLFEEVTVTGLNMVYYIFGDYTTTGDEEDNILLIPLDRSITANYSIPVKEELYSRSLHFVFNSRVVTKVRWYQTGIFRIIMFVIAVIITIYNAPAGLALLELTGTALIVAAIVINLVVGIILQAAFKLFVKVFGADIAQAIAILAIIYGGYQMIQAGSLQATWATELLELSNGLNSAAIQDRFYDLLDETKQFGLFADEQTKLLDTANELLEKSTVLSPMVIFGEKPEDFYNRSIHYGNIGTLGITAISSYVDIALTLPKLNDTVGEENYAA